MIKQIKGQFHIIRASIKNIDASRAHNDYRKCIMLLQVWKNTFNFLMEHADSNYDRNVARSYYSRITAPMAKELSWEQMKQLTNAVMEGKI